MWPKYWSFSFSISPSNEYSWLTSLGLTGLISLQSKGVSRVFSNTTVQKHPFFVTQPSLWSNSHIHTWLLETISLRSHLVVSDSLRPHGLLPTRLLRPWNLQARILEWVAISFSRGSSRPRDWTRVSRIAGRGFNLWATRKAQLETIALTKRAFVGKVISLSFNMLFKLVIAFLPRSKSLLKSWLQSPSAVIVKPPKNKVSQCFHYFPIYLPWSDRTRCHDLSFLNAEL